MCFDFCISPVKKQQGKFCCAYACNNKPVAKLGGLCYKHYWRKQRINNPIGIRYNQWRQKCKKRNIPNNVTLEEFHKFCQDTGYLIKKGLRGKNATIDRKRNWEGYTIDNMQLLKNMANIRKYYDYDRYEQPPEDWIYDGPGPPETNEHDFKEDEVPF